MDDHIDNCFRDKFITLFDVWQKLVQYKAVFLSIFFVSLVIGGTMVLKTPQKYIFSQVIEIGRSFDDKGLGIRIINTDDAVMQIKKVFYFEAVYAYNAQAAKKMMYDSRRLIVEDAGNGALLLSVHGQLKDADGYKFIMRKIIDDFINSTKEYADYRKKVLSDAKDGLERRLVSINDFYKDILDKGFNVDAKKPKNIGSLAENKIVSMYLNDQSASILKLTNEISMLQTQIFSTYNTRVSSDLIIFDKPVVICKNLLLVLVASLFFAFFGVFLISLIIRIKRFGNKDS
jgi:hypothetical protein